MFFNHVNAMILQAGYLEDSGHPSYGAADKRLGIGNASRKTRHGAFLVISVCHFEALFERPPIQFLRWYAHYLTHQMVII